MIRISILSRLVRAGHARSGTVAVAAILWIAPKVSGAEARFHPVSADPPCSVMWQWREDDIAFDDWAHSASDTDPNTFDPEGEWYPDGYDGVTENVHYDWGVGKTADHHTIVCAGWHP